MAYGRSLNLKAKLRIKVKANFFTEKSKLLIKLKANS